MKSTLFLFALVGISMAEEISSNSCSIKLTKVSEAANKSQSSTPPAEEKKTDNGVATGSVPPGLLRRILAEERNKEAEIERELKLSELESREEADLKQALPSDFSFDELTDEELERSLENESSEVVQATKGTQGDKIETDALVKTEEKKGDTQVVKGEVETAATKANEQTTNKLDQIQKNTSEVVTEVKEEAKKIAEDVIGTNDIHHYEVNYLCSGSGPKIKITEGNGHFTCPKAAKDFKLVYKAKGNEVNNVEFPFEKHLGSSNSVNLIKQDFSFTDALGGFEYTLDGDSCTLYVGFSKIFAGFLAVFLALAL